MTDLLTHLSWTQTAIFKRRHSCERFKPVLTSSAFPSKLPKTDDSRKQLRSCGNRKRIPGDAAKTWHVAQILFRILCDGRQRLNTGPNTCLLGSDVTRLRAMKMILSHYVTASDFESLRIHIPQNRKASLLHAQKISLSYVSDWV